MKTLKEYIIEGILDIEDNIENLIEKALIEDFIKENYEVDKKLQIKKKVDKYIVSTNGDVIVTNKNITALTNGLFEWGEVKGFYCANCTSLKSLNGTPKKVGEYFNCSNCASLKSLEGAPEKVGRSFYCLGCTSLKSLEGAPKEVGTNFDCGNCTSLKSLEGAPEKVGNFYCYGCTSLQSLKGAPKKVGKDFYCRNCTSLKSLEGAPEKVGEDFRCERCGKKFTEKDVRAICDVKGQIKI